MLSQDQYGGPQALIEHAHSARASRRTGRRAGTWAEVFFGGRPTNVPMPIQAVVFLTYPKSSMLLFPETWMMAATPETWAIGRNYVGARVEVTADAVVGITYIVDGSLDLRTENKSPTYTAAAVPLNLLLQGIGGSEFMKTYGSWHRLFNLRPLKNEVHMNLNG